MGTLPPAGWYDVGGGQAGLWNGERWTGDRAPIDEIRLPPVSPRSGPYLATGSWRPADGPGRVPPPPVAPRPPVAVTRPTGAPGRGLKWWQLVGIIVVVVVGLGAVSKAAQDSATPAPTRSTVSRAEAEADALVAVLAQVNPGIVVDYRADPEGTIAVARDTADSICSMSVEAHRQGVEWGTAIAAMYARMDRAGQAYFGGPAGLATAAGALIQWRCPDTADLVFDR